MASVMILALGDSVSRFVGPYGYLKHPFIMKNFLKGLLLALYFAEGRIKNKEYI